MAVDHSDQHHQFYEDLSSLRFRQHDLHDEEVHRLASDY